MDSNVDPYKVLELQRNFTLEELKHSYKRIAVKVHPDKGGNEYMFNLVTECFKHLMREYKRRTSDLQYGDLKSAFKKAETGGGATPSVRPRPNETKGDGRFDVKKFNKMFDDNRLEDVHDTGYEDWYKKEETKDAPKFKGGGREAFNMHFEKHTVANAAKNKHIIKYEEPEAYWSTNLPCMELGTSAIADFSGDNTTLKRLNYSDLKLAHSTTRIVDPTTVNRKDYQSIDELKRDRGNVKYEMNEEEQRQYIRRQRAQEDAEYKRRSHLNNKDLEVEKHYNKVHNLLKQTLR
jgi:curved DNA-binding protein CbpA